MHTHVKVLTETRLFPRPKLQLVVGHQTGVLGNKGWLSAESSKLSILNCLQQPRHDFSVLLCSSVLCEIHSLLCFFPSCVGFTSLLHCWLGGHGLLLVCACLEICMSSTLRDYDWI